MIRDFSKDCLRRFKGPLQKGRLTLVVPDEINKGHLQRVFRESIKLATGILPEILTVSELAAKVRGKPNPSSFSLWISLMEKICALRPKTSFHAALQKAQLLLRTAQFCFQDGGSIHHPPLPFVSLRGQDRDLFDILQRIEQQIEGDDILLKRFLNDHFRDFFVFLDAFPHKDAPFLQCLRAVFPHHSQAFVWNSGEIDRQRKGPLFVGEFANTSQEAAFVVREVTRRIQHGCRVAVVCDEENILQKIEAEGQRQHLIFQRPKGTVPLKETIVGNVVSKLALWLAHDSVENWTCLLGVLADQAFIPESKRRFLSKFWEKVTHAPGMTVGGNFLIPKFAKGHDIRVLIAKTCADIPEIMEIFDALAEIQNGYRFPQRFQSLREFCWLHQSAWNDLWQQFEVAKPEIPLWENMTASLNHSPLFDEKITADDYLFWLDAFLHTERVSVPSGIHKSQQDDPWILPVQASILHDVDTVFLVGTQETWMRSSPTPPFFQPQSSTRQWEPIFRRLVNQKIVYVTRSLEGQPHPLWHALSNLPIEKVDISSTSKQVASNNDGMKVASRAHAWVEPLSRPRQFSISDWQLLQDDPYAFYAKTILKLSPLPQRDAMARDYGLWAHYLLQRYFTHPFQQKSLMAFIDEATLQAPRWVTKIFVPRILPALKAIDESWKVEQPSVLEVQTETRQSASLLVDDVVFTFYGICDRIDRLTSAIRVVDYKTGTLPKEKSLRTCEAWQLPLEAWMIHQSAPQRSTVMSPVSLKAEGVRQRDVPYDSEIQMRLEGTLPQLLHAYLDPSFMFETAQENKKRLLAYAPLARLPRQRC